MVLCCLCGTTIEHNAVVMCADCIRLETDISGDIGTNYDLHQCNECQRFHITREKWIRYEFETTGLLGLCLKKVPKLQHKETKIIDAKWIWTEPHSKRLKILVDIEKMVLDKVNVRSRIIIEYVLKSRQCVDCLHNQTAHNFGALVQIRQKGVKSKKTLSNLENILANKPRLQTKLQNIQIRNEGFDLYCKDKAFSDKLVGFINSKFPTRCRSSKKVVSTDVSNSSARCEYTTQVEIAPLTKNDLLISAADVTGHVDLMLIRNISSNIHLISPITTNMCELTHVKYFSKPFTPLFSECDMVAYVVMDIEPVANSQNNHNAATKVKHRHKGKDSASCVSNPAAVTPLSIFAPAPNPTASGAEDKICAGVVASGVAAPATHQHQLYAQLAEAWVVREVDLGTCDNLEDVTLHCYTHLGHLLHAGDVVMGYDLKHATNVVTATVFNEDENEHTASATVSSAAELDNSHLIPRLPFDIPDVVLVRKQTSKEAYRAQVKMENAGLKPLKLKKGKGNRRAKKTKRNRKGEQEDMYSYGEEMQDEDPEHSKYLGEGLFSNANSKGYTSDSEDEFHVQGDELEEYLKELDIDADSEAVDDY